MSKNGKVIVRTTWHWESLNGVCVCAFVCEREIERERELEWEWESEKGVEKESERVMGWEGRHCKTIFDPNTCHYFSEAQTLNSSKKLEQKLEPKNFNKRTSSSKKQRKKFFIWRCQHNFLNTVRCQCFGFYRFYAFLTTHTTRSKMPKIIPAFKTANYSVLKDTFLPSIASSLRKDFFFGRKRAASKLLQKLQIWAENGILMRLYHGLFHFMGRNRRKRRLICFGALSEVTPNM